MRLTPGAATAANLYMLTQSARFPTVASTNNTEKASNWATLFFSGTPPTKSEVDTAINGINNVDTGGTNREPFLNFQDLVVSRLGDYLGGVTAYKVPTVTRLSKSSLQFALYSIFNADSNMISASGRSSVTYTQKSGVATWALVVVNANQTINLAAANPMAGTATDCIFGFVCSVGDLNSSAEIKLASTSLTANGGNLGNPRNMVYLDNFTLNH